MDMDPRIKELFLEAMQQPEELRSKFLEDRCDDEELREEVLSLIEHHGADPDFLVTPPMHQFIASESGPASSVPERIGEFQIIRELGRGGMGIVYLAEDTALGRSVAIKTLPPHFTVSERSVARFRHEAKAAAKLTHPGIVPIYRFGEAQGIHYIVSEFIEGTTLAQRLALMRHQPPNDAGTPATRGMIGDQTRTSSTPSADETPPPTSPPTTKGALHEAVALVAATADALDYAHEHNIIHRDVKPANLLIDADGAPHLADFGLAKNLDEDSLSQIGELAGTYHYMSPEQALAKRVEVDARTDIYSLGIVLYEMLTLRVPFQGDSAQQILHAISFGHPKSVRASNPAVPRTLEIICHKAIEKNPNDRYPSAAQFAADLRCFLAGKPITGRRPGLVRRSMQFVRRHRRAAIAAAAAIVAGSAFLAGYLIWSDSTPAATLIVTSATAGADVYLRAIDIESGSPGEEKHMGETPLDTDVQPGYYRIIVKAGNGGFAELTRYLPADQEHEVHARIRPTLDAIDGMVRIEAGEFEAGMVTETWPELGKRLESLEPFWIDPFEVSNRDYRAFVDASNHRKPRLWGDAYPPRPVNGVYPAHEWDDLPVTSVSWKDARAYAEYRGKRLPTSVEWERAARGANALLYPWGDRGDVQARANAYGEDHKVWTSGSDDPELRKHYAGSVKPVNQMPEGIADVSPDGLYHMAGNVAEWTESMFFTVVDDEVMPEYYSRFVRSDSWGRDLTDYYDLSNYMVDSIEGNLISRGFRCARRVSP